MISAAGRCDGTLVSPALLIDAFAADAAHVNPRLQALCEGTKAFKD